MSQSGFVQGLEEGAQTAAGVPAAVTHEGWLRTKEVSDLLAETNRLLRKLILGLEQWTGNEFPDAD